MIFAINFRYILFIVVGGEKLLKSFCFGYIANNDWKIYSIKAVFKAAAVIAIASILFHSLLTLYKLSLRSFLRSPCFVKQIAEHESLHILLSSNYQIAFIQNTISTKCFFSMNFNEMILKVFVFEIIH